MSKFQKLTNGAPRATSVASTDIASGAATSTQFLAADGSGSAAFRALVSGDIPSLSSIYLPLSGGSLTGSANSNFDSLTHINNGTSGAGLSVRNFYNTFNGSSVTAVGGIIATGSTYTAASGINANAFAIDGIGAGGLALVAENASGVINFVTGGAASTNVRMIIGSAGIVGIGSTASTSWLNIGGGNNPLSGTSQIGIQSGFTSTSAATSSIRGFQSSLSQAASITTGNVFQFIANTFTKGSGATVTTLTDFISLAASGHAATNNACFADNNGYSGNYFLNQSGSDPSLLTGILQVGGANGSSATPLYTKVTGGTNAIGAAFNTTATNGAIIQVRQSDVTHTLLGSSANALGTGAATDTALVSNGTLYLASNAVKAVTLDTNQNTILAKTLAQPNYAASSFATTGTFSAGANTSGVINTNSSTIASFTLKLPPTPLDGQMYFFGTSGQIVALTIQDSAGGTVTGGKTSVAADLRGQSFVYSATTVKWHAIS